MLVAREDKRGHRLLTACVVRLGPVALVTAALGACAGSDSDAIARTESEIEASRWNVNDVSFLFPHPADASEAQYLLPVTTLLPESVFALLGQRDTGLPYLIETAARTTLYPTLRISAARIDPCAEPGCVRQARLTGQPFLDGELIDASIHLFYPLDEPTFDTLVSGLRELKRANTGNPPLGVHPVMIREGLAGSFRARLNDLLLDACTSARLAKLTFMATGRSGNNWFWHAVERRSDGTWAALHDALHDSSFTQRAQGSEHDGVPLASPLFPDELLRSADIPQLSGDAFTAAIEKLQRIENPDLLSTSEVACNACHVADTTHGNAVSKRGLARTPVTPFTFVAPKGQTLARAVDANRNGRNMHAFSWFQKQATVSQRTIHESAKVAEAMAHP